MLPALKFLEGVALVGVLFAVFLYAPFAKKWTWALGIAYGAMMIFSGIYAVTCFRLGQDTPPGIYMLAMGFIAMAWAAATRGVKIALFKIPALFRLEERVRRKWKRPSA